MCDVRIGEHLATHIAPLNGFAYVVSLICAVAGLLGFLPLLIVAIVQLFREPVAEELLLPAGVTMYISLRNLRPYQFARDTIRKTCEGYHVALALLPAIPHREILL